MQLQIVAAWKWHFWLNVAIPCDNQCGAIKGGKNAKRSAENVLAFIG